MPPVSVQCRTTKVRRMRIQLLRPSILITDSDGSSMELSSRAGSVGAAIARIALFRPQPLPRTLLAGGEVSPSSTLRSLVSRVRAACGSSLNESSGGLTIDAEFDLPELSGNRETGLPFESDGSPLCFDWLDRAMDGSREWKKLVQPKALEFEALLAQYYRRLRLANGGPPAQPASTRLGDLADRVHDLWLLWAVQWESAERTAAGLGSEDESVAARIVAAHPGASAWLSQADGLALGVESHQRPLVLDLADAGDAMSLAAHVARKHLGAVDVVSGDGAKDDPFQSQDPGIRRLFSLGAAGVRRATLRLGTAVRSRASEAQDCDLLLTYPEAEDPAAARATGGRIQLIAGMARKGRVGPLLQWDQHRTDSLQHLIAELEGESGAGSQSIETRQALAYLRFLQAREAGRRHAAFRIGEDLLSTLDPRKSLPLLERLIDQWSEDAMGIGEWDRVAAAAEGLLKDRSLEPRFRSRVEDIKLCAQFMVPAKRKSAIAQSRVLAREAGQASAETALRDRIRYCDAVAFDVIAAPGDGAEADVNDGVALLEEAFYDLPGPDRSMMTGVAARTLARAHIWRRDWDGALAWLEEARLAFQKHPFAPAESSVHVFGVWIRTRTGEISPDEICHEVQSLSTRVIFRDPWDDRFLARLYQRALEAGLEVFPEVE